MIIHEMHYEQVPMTCHECLRVKPVLYRVVFKFGDQIMLCKECREDAAFELAMHGEERA